MTIALFTPLYYDVYHKTRLQRALEIADEYFYWGGKPRFVIVWDPNSDQSQQQARHSYEARHRSWINVSIKIVS